MSKVETVEVTLRLPKPIAEWFKDEDTKNLEDRLTLELIGVVLSQVEADNAELHMRKYGLRQVFKDYGVLPSYYKDPEVETK